MDPENPIDQQRRRVHFETQEELEKFLAGFGSGALRNGDDVLVTKLAQLKADSVYHCFVDHQGTNFSQSSFQRARVGPSSSFRRATARNGANSNQS